MKCAFAPRIHRFAPWSALRSLLQKALWLTLVSPVQPDMHIYGTQPIYLAP